MKRDDKAPRPLKEASILVVEDHTFVLDMLERMLASKVGGLHSARSGEDAFYNLEKNPSLAHVAIVDYHLLGMNGVKFIEKLRAAKSEILKNLPVIMMTGDNDMELYRSAARLGIAAFLIKPVATATLVEALEAALAGRKVAPPRLDGKQIADISARVLPKKAKSTPQAADSSQPSEDEEPPPDAPPPPPRRPIDFKT